MIDEPLPPEFEDEDNVFFTVQERIAFHLARSKKRGDDHLAAATVSRLWLMENGIIPDTRAKPFVSDPKARSGALSLGNPSRRLVGAKTDPPPRRKAVLTCLEDIQEEEYEWLWPGRIPLRTVSLIAGDGGAGKSTLTGALATAVTTGGCWPDLPGQRIEEGSVVVLSAEENPATDMRPRLRKFGADASRIHILSAMQASDGSEDRFSLMRDVPYLAEAVAAIGDVRLVLVDPIGSYLSGSDTGNDADVQAALLPLFGLAEAHRLGVVLIAHLTKATSSDIQARIQGSAAFVNKSRMVWFYSADPRDHSRRLLSFIKGNPVDKVTTALSIGFNGSVLAWDPEPVHLSAKQVAYRLAQQAARGELDGKRGPRAEVTTELTKFVLARLADGAISLADLRAEALQVHEAKRATLHDAIKKLGKKLHPFTAEDGSKWIELAPELGLKDGADPASPEAPK